MDSDEESYTPSWKGVNGTIILINLFEANTRPIASRAHLASCKVVKQCLRSSSSQNLAVCFYGIDDASTSLLDAKGVLDVFTLALPTLDDYKKLRDIDLLKFKKSSEFKMSDVLWHCSKMFANFKKQMSNKSILILTQLNIPPIDADQKPTLERVYDLVDSNVNIKFINVAENEYEVHEFYKNFLENVNIGKEFVVPKPVWESKEIEKLLYQESHRHLAVAQLQFEISEGFAIGVGIYNLIKSKQSFHKTVKLDSETNKPVTSVTKTMKVAIDNNDDKMIEDSEPKQIPLLKSELIYSAEYGSKMVNFTSKEYKQIRNPFGPPMLKLLGFKPAHTLSKEKWFLKMCNFLYPNESLVEGSTVAFKSLHKACTELSVVAICVLSTRINARPKIVALSPCTNPIGLDVDVGFDIILIPFVENVRDIPVPEENNVVVSEAHKVAMKHVLEKTLFDFTADMFEDPRLQSQYRAIETIALDDEELEPFVDTTKPCNEAFGELNESLFHDIFGVFGAVPKRSAPKQASESKKPKLEEVDQELLQDRIENHSIIKYTVNQLKQILKSKDIPDLPPLTNLKKDKLVQLVYENFSE